MQMKTKERRILLFSILSVLIMAWLLGNLRNLEMETFEQTLILPDFLDEIWFITSMLLIIGVIGYFTSLVLRSKRTRTSILKIFTMLGFWLFLLIAIFLVIILFVFGAGTFVVFDIPIDLDQFSIGFEVLDIGILIFLVLIGSLFIFAVYLKIVENKTGKIEKEKIQKDILLEGEENHKNMTIEESLSSTLNNAITELKEGEDIRSTIVIHYRKMNEILEKKGAKNEKYMTPREYNKKMKNTFPEIEDTISEITFLFEEARYSPHDLTEEDRTEVQKKLKRLKEELK